MPTEPEKDKDAAHPPADEQAASSELSDAEAKEVEPFALEEPEPAKHEPEQEAVVSVEDVESCPNCGAPMAGHDSLVCLRCGYDLKTLSVQRTAVGKADSVDEDEDDSEHGPVSRKGRGDVWLPLAMAAISALILIVGYLSGAAALFPTGAGAGAGAAEAPATVPVGERLQSTVQFLVLMLLWSGCALAGLFMLAQTLQRPVGDLQLAAARALGIVCTIRLAAFLSLPGPRWVEWMGEAVIQAAAFVALAILLFALKPRSGLIMGGFSLMAFIVLWLFARAMVWTIEGGV